MGEIKFMKGNKSSSLDMILFLGDINNYFRSNLKISIFKFLKI